MTKSKFAFGYLYFIFPFFFLFFFVGVFFLVSPGTIEGRGHSDSMLWIPGLLFSLGGGAFIYMTLKKMVVVRVYPDRIELKSLFFEETIFKEEIISVDVSARGDSGFAGSNRPTNAIAIQYRGSEKIVLPDIFYRNSAELKRTVQEYFVPGAEAAPLFPDTISGKEVLPSGEEEAAEKFAGNALLSTNGITLLLSALALLFLVPQHRHKVTDPFLVTYSAPMLVLPLLYFALGAQMCYFKVSDKYLIVRNQFLPWYRRSYRLDEIKDIVFERPYKRSYCLRVNARDFSSKSFSAGSLRDDGWKALKKKLEKAGIRVRSEI